MFSDSAFEIWNDLRDCFQQSNGPRIFQLRRDLLNHVQNQQFVSVYVTKLKTLWEELSNFRPICSCGKCSCGGVQNLNAYFQMEYVMSFLMGLNDSFAQIRAQVLLSDPLPHINKVFSLVVQEERQRNVTAHISSREVDSTNNLAFAIRNNASKRPVFDNVNNKNQRKDRPFCTHCNFFGHTIEKCYKLHGYPPGYKPKQRSQPMVGNSMQNVAANQVSTQIAPGDQHQILAMLEHSLILSVLINISSL